MDIKWIITFLVLKIVEIILIIFLPYFIGKFALEKMNEDEDSKFIKWLAGIVIIILLGVIIAIASRLIQGNIELVNHIMRIK